ncbi:glycoside hydrolase family 88 protein, partial [bacterium]
MLINSVIRAQTLSEKVAQTAMKIWPDTSSTKFARWTYDEGVVMEGMAAIWKRTADASYYRYIQKSMDKLVDSSGVITGYKAPDFNIDNIKTGRS